MTWEKDLGNPYGALTPAEQAQEDAFAGRLEAALRPVVEGMRAGRISAEEGTIPEDPGLPETPAAVHATVIDKV